MGNLLPADTVSLGSFSLAIELGDLDKILFIAIPCEKSCLDYSLTIDADHDLLLCPTSPVSAHRHEAPELVINGVSVQGRNSLRATVPFDLTGSPAVTVPFGYSNDGLPIGVQLVAPHFGEGILLHAAAALEHMRAGTRRHPSL